MLFSCAECSPILCTSRVAAYHEQRRGHLVAVGIRGNNVDLIGSFVQLSRCCECALFVGIDEVSIHTHDECAERDATDDQRGCAEWHFYVVLEWIDDLHRQPHLHALVSHRQDRGWVHGWATN